MTSLMAVMLNCTLKYSPEVSNTEALMLKVKDWWDAMDVETEIVRVTDFEVRFGVSSDEGNGDQWPQVTREGEGGRHQCIVTPIWFGVRGSVAQMVIERLDGTYNERNEAGQYPLYNKVGCVVVTGKRGRCPRGGRDHPCSTLSHLGCAIPPNADTYWVGDAGPGPSYIEAGGSEHAYTKRTTRWMAHNTVHLARILKATPIPAEGNTFDEETDHGPMHIG